MLEYLALPAWNTPETSIDAWVARLSETGGRVIVSHESSTVTWLEAALLRLRGFVVVENGHAAAINFELHDHDPQPATRVLEAAAEALGWELYLDDDHDTEEDEDD
jgi:hypothetical protein